MVYPSACENKPDVVVSDIMMPGVSGYDLLNIIRNNKNISNNNVPFIFLSALGKKEEMVKGIGLTANDYLTKPIDFDLLTAKIKEKYNNSKHIEDTHRDDIEGLKNQVSEIFLLKPYWIYFTLNKVKYTIKNLKKNFKA